jgi:hypothetical protein
MLSLAFACLGLLLVSPGSATAQPGQDVWTAEVIPYLWAASLQGNTAAGDAESPIDPGYSLFTLDNLHGAFMGAIRLSRGHWSWSADTLKVDFQDDFSGRIFDTHVGLSGGFLEIASGYRPDEQGNLEWLVGVRDVTFTSEVGLTPGPSGSVSKSWIDPFVGLRYRYPLTDTWAVQMRADAGGLNPSARLSVNAIVALQYQVNEHFQLMAGYRYLELDFRSNDFLLDLSATGFALGAVLRY